MKDQANAIRVEDDVGEGDAVSSGGSPDTTVGGKAAARYADGTRKGRVASASSTVFINGIGAARHGDFVRAVRSVEKPDGTVEKVLFVEAVGHDRGVSMAVGAARLATSGKPPWSDTTVYGMDLEVATAKASSNGHERTMGARLVSLEGTSRWAPFGDADNPLTASRYHAEVLEASAHWDRVEDDGRRIGVGAVAEAGAEIAKVGAKSRFTVPLWRGSPYTLSYEKHVEISAGSAALGGGGMAFYDLAERRFHLVALIRFGWGVGTRARWDISIGRKLGAAVPVSGRERSRPMEGGSPTVHVGD